MKNPEDYIVRTSQISPEQEFDFAHPHNPQSRVRLMSLSEAIGMKQVALHMGRIPPGKESFVPHAHASQEEFIFILQGNGQVALGDKKASIGPGDFVGFPIDGVPHQLYNTGTEELVYLMGGERMQERVDIVDFPTLGKTGFWANGTMRYVDNDATEDFRPEDFAAPKST